MSDVGMLPRVLSVLHSLPLWILVAFAAVGYATLFAPSFGGADLITFRTNWGWLCWLDAVSFSIFSAACAIDLAVKAVRSWSKKKFRHQRTLYFQIYTPLYDQLTRIHIITSSATLAPFLRQRIRNAFEKLRTVKNKRVAIKAASELHPVPKTPS
jgi:hypothetical protein